MYFFHLRILRTSSRSATIRLLVTRGWVITIVCCSMKYWKPFKHENKKIWKLRGISYKDIGYFLLNILLQVLSTVITKYYHTYSGKDNSFDLSSTMFTNLPNIIIQICFRSSSSSFVTAWNRWPRKHWW